MFLRGRLFTALCTIMLVTVLACPAFSQPGDCDSDGMVNTSDAVYLVNYLFAGGPAPAMDDCDCDAFPGVNYGDLVQLLMAVYFGGTLYPPFGTDYIVPTHFKLYFNVQVPQNMASFDVGIYVDVPAGFNVESFILPFSFDNLGTQAAMTCNSIDFTGSVGNTTYLSGSFNNATETFYIQSNAYGGTCLSAGTYGLLCKVNFTSGAGTPNDIVLTSTNKLWPMLLGNDTYPGTDGRRVYHPEVIRARYGDVNSDGSVDISDAIVIINYAFGGGPVPGFLEP